MIARIEERQALPTDLDPTYIARHRAWIAEQPGFCGGYHLLEPDTGRALSLTMWQDEDALAAVERAQAASQGPADGRLSRQTSPTVRLVQVAAVF
jgi:heme-degrading monooxygenase HmoA